MLTRIASFFSSVLGVVLTLLIAGMGLTLYAIYHPMYLTVQEKAHQQSIMVDEAKYSPYDNRVTSGSQLVTAMRRYSLQDGFYIYVNRSAEGKSNFIANPANGSTSCKAIDFSTGNTTGGTTSGCSVTEAQILDETSPYYVPSQDRFTSRLVRDSNGLVSGILFIYG